MSPMSFYPHLRSMDRGYRYALTDSPNHKWYRARTDDILAINSDEKLTLICVGTQATIREWLTNFQIHSSEWLNMGRVHSGFAKNVHELLGRQDESDSLITQCINANRQGKSIEIEGHSRGYPIAILLATQLIAHKVKADRITVIGCAGAKIGSRKFAREYEKMLGSRTFVLNGGSDPVPNLPPWGATNGKVTKISFGWMPKHRLKHYIEALT